MKGDFYNDLEDGKRGEALIIKALAAKGHTITDLSNDKAAAIYDIDLQLTNKNGQTTTLEIKNDMRSEETGNLFIEIYNNTNRAHNYYGWFYYCGADYIAFLQENNRIAHIVSMDDLRALVEANEYRQARSRNSTGYLVPVYVLSTLRSYYQLQI